MAHKIVICPLLRTMLVNRIISFVLALCLQAQIVHCFQGYRQSHHVANANHIFNTIHSSMRQWGPSLNHNGMSLFLAVVPEGTILYHGTNLPDAESGMEWVAFERDLALQFAHLYLPPSPLPPPLTLEPPFRSVKEYKAAQLGKSSLSSPEKRNQISLDTEQQPRDPDFPIVHYQSIYPYATVLAAFASWRTRIGAAASTILSEWKLVSRSSYAPSLKVSVLWIIRRRRISIKGVRAGKGMATCSCSPVRWHRWFSS